MSASSEIERRGWSRRAVFAAGGAAVCAYALRLPPANAQPRAPVPPAAETTEDGFRLLRARSASLTLRNDGPPLVASGYEGSVPGPLLRVRRGGEVKTRLVNQLTEPTAIHWHGVRLPNAMDGAVPLTQAAVAPGGSFDYRFAPPDAGTYLYHPVMLGGAGVAQGLYGLLVVDEDQPVDVDQDVALALDAWDTSTATEADPQLLVNGRPALDIPVRRHQRLRLRLVNASRRIPLAIRIEQHRPVVMAIDGQPAAPFVARDGRVVLGPGNRIDLFVDAMLGPGATAPVIIETPRGKTALARLVYDKGEPARAEPRGEPTPLPATSLPQRMDFAPALKLNLPLDPAANRAAMPLQSGREKPRRTPDDKAAIWSARTQFHHQPGPPLFSVKRGRTVMLAFANRGSAGYALHAHGHSFRLLDSLDDGWKPFWLDTLVVTPQRTERIAFVADNPGKWLLHAVTLDEKSAGDLVGWFEVT